METKFEATDLSGLDTLPRQRKEIAREQLDLYNRLHSISEDVEFVKLVAQTLSTLPLVPNQRCGAWYVDPCDSHSDHAYWKSTDGHAGVWRFSLRRSNLHLVKTIVKHGGMIIVDSTRKGKRFPDALSKTIPIWCSVLNQARMMRDKTGSLTHTSDWKTYASLHTPSTTVAASEHDQIVARIPDWAQSLLDSSFDLSQSVDVLDKPLRPIFISPNTFLDTLSLTQMQQLFHPIVCLSASQFTRGGTCQRMAGYTYVQGSGDDHESWGKGLNPNLFWSRQRELLSASRTSIDDVVTNICSLTPSTSSTRESRLFQVIGTNLFLVLDSTNDASQLSHDGMSVIVTRPKSQKEVEEKVGDDVVVTIRPKKKGLEDLRNALDWVMKKCANHLRSDGKVYITTDSDKELSDVAVESTYNDDRKLILEVNKHNKETIAARLQWIIESTRGLVNPPRSLIKTINEFFLSQRPGI